MTKSSKTWTNMNCGWPIFNFAPFVAFFLSTILVASVHGEDYKTVGVNAHNRKRALHQGIDPVVIDNEIQDMADKCARFYGLLRIIDHNCPYKRTAKYPPFKNYGENLFMSTGAKADPKTDINKAIDGWYAEIKDWDFSKSDGKNGKKLEDTLHFTQLVWKASTRIGIGYYTNPTTKTTVVVTLYGPSGNNADEMKDNVLPLKTS